MTPPPASDETQTPIGDGRFAEATYRPETVDELCAIVRDAAARGLAVYPQGGATALDYGDIPERPGIAVRLDALNRVIDYPAADMTITVEGGLTLGSIRQIVGEQSQRLAIEAPDPDRATLGGIFATAWTGPRRFGWGRPRDQIIGVGFVSAAGELIRGGGRVVKNVAGYDFPKLLTGSMGTLGIITELTLKVNPQPEASAIVAVGFDSLSHAAEAIQMLNLSATRPVALELIDPTQMENSGWRLLVGFEGNRAAVEWQVERLPSELSRVKPLYVIPHTGEADVFWQNSVAHEYWLAEPCTDSVPIMWRASFAPAAALKFLDKVDLDRWRMRTHAGNGVVRGFARFGADRATWLAEVQRLRTEADRLGGALILSSCPTEWKAEFEVWGPRRPDWAIMQRVKAALDPRRTLNPGRFVGTI